MAINRAVYQDKAGVTGVIREGPTHSELSDHQILIKVHAWAVNPADIVVQDQSLPFITYPLILGSDVAGVIERVGSAAPTNFKVGDRVFGFSFNNGFQDYVILEQSLAARIPDSLSFTEASVFPLCISTSASGLFDQRYLGLPLPSLSPTNQGRSVLIWGGSSAIGSNAIQLCKAAGFEVVTTCSPRSFEYVKGLGADKVFDYSSPSVIGDIVAELDKGTCAGIYHAVGSVAPACQISHKSRQDLFVASTNPIAPEDIPEGVKAKFTFDKGDLSDFDGSIPATFGGFFPEALEKGVYKVAPLPKVVSTRGLEGIQEAMDMLKQGVSATKLVITRGQN